MRRHQGLLNETRSLQASLATLEADHNRSTTNSQVSGCGQSAVYECCVMQLTLCSLPDLILVCLTAHLRAVPMPVYTLIKAELHLYAQNGKVSLVN